MFELFSSHRICYASYGIHMRLFVIEGLSNIDSILFSERAIIELLNMV